jgi:hypothetical protein
MQDSAGRRTMFKVLTPIEKKGGGGTYWMRVGTAYHGKDPTTFNIYLDAIPTGSGKLHMREMDEDDFHKSDRSDRGDRRDRFASSSAPSASATLEDAPF